MVIFINTHGATANKFSGLSDFIARPDWIGFEQFLKDQIDYAELKGDWDANH
jgi:hypothetical protein